MEITKQSQMIRNIPTRLLKNKIFTLLFLLATLTGLLVLAILLFRIFSQGIGYINWDFLTSFASRRPSDAGIKAAIYGTIWMMGVTAPIAFTLGVGTALYLEEYASKNIFTKIIQMNISNLAGVPSIVFGLLGLTLFVRGLGLDRSVLAGGLTMALLILPIIVVASQEAIRAVPKELKEASFGMGATKWQTIRRVVLPVAIPGILTGNILALSRAIGETAPLIMIGALTYIAFVPENLMSQFTVMPIQIFNWTGRPQEEFQYVAAAGIIVLLGMLLIMNSVAVLIRNKFQKRY
ncbi:phosphate ABC transporter permease PstA [Anaerobacillus isosaccharinicus]|uniref:Phosphate transport system permease protein PstA n=1 Tax=Anaerobacillus isosaccharinicus TaxID=1532552 RepID=A0A1S2MCX2_9BACI|nr:phosphate ABC transporter permease PstA [Anaerobacillus isosaccharinicus]MBA5587799.1 phosphate ABC transporter permease PstA [Anaerobacillus isosaccharinicus]QOY34044.1 phosphate ABC transporter permease PstA [Anaerobacillus isosaccharinicus]